MLRRIFYVMCLVAAVAQAKSVVITGKAKNHEAGTIYLFVYDGLELKLQDSTRVKNGVFVFKNREIPRGLYKMGINTTDAADIILGHESIGVSFDKNNFASSFKVEKSPENDGLARFNKANISFGTQLQGLETRAQGLYQYKTTDPARFELEIGKLQKTADSLTNVLYAEYAKLATNPSLFIAKYANALTQRDTTKRQNVFKNAELSDPELCRSNLFAIKTQMYFQRYTKPEIPDYQASADELIQNLPPKTKGKEQVYKTILSIFANANLDYYSVVLAKFKQEYADQKSVAEYIKKLPKRDIAVGDEVPEITLKDTEGKDLSLSSLRGKVVLIDFWASWCGPCRAENPNVVRVYGKYKDKGFTVFGVSLDQNREKWLSAIKSDGLAWSHVSDLKGWSSEGAKLYGVKSIPQTYLIDKEGKVIAKNLRGEMLELKLKEIFNE